MKDLLRREPVTVTSLITAAIALAVGFGAPITDGQVGLIVAFVAAVLGFVARSQVSPVADDHET